MQPRWPGLVGGQAGGQAHKARVTGALEGGDARPGGGGLLDGGSRGSPGSLRAAGAARDGPGGSRGVGHGPGGSEEGSPVMGAGPGQGGRRTREHQQNSRLSKESS